MRLAYLYSVLVVTAMLFVASCSCNTKKKPNAHEVFKGLYSFGPEVKSFRACGDSTEYWVADSSAQLELQYSQLNFEKPYEPVYIIVEGTKKASDKEGLGSDFDSTLVVRRVIKITKEIPEDSCL